MDDGRGKAIATATVATPPASRFAGSTAPRDGAGDESAFEGRSPGSPVLIVRLPVPRDSGVSDDPHRLTVAGAAAAWRAPMRARSPHSRFTRRARLAPADTCDADSSACALVHGGPRAGRAAIIRAPFGNALVASPPIYQRSRDVKDAVAHKLYIRTFGCQMNEYDSAKMADVLAATDGLDADRDARRRGRHPVQHLLGARKGAGARVPRPGARARAEAREPDADHRRRRLRRVPGGRGDRRARAVRRRRVRAADAAPAAGADPRAARKRASRRSTSPFPRSRSSTTCRRRASTARGIRVDHGGLQQVLLVLRRAVHARRGGRRPFDDVLTEVADLAARA